MDKTRVVVTGINGFVGHHLAKKIHDEGHVVIGVGQDSAPSPLLATYVDEYHQANLIEAWPEIKNVDGIIHLAGLASVGPSFDNPQLYINGNSAMVTNMAEYFLKQDKKPRIIVVSSGAIYGPDQPMPLTEKAAFGFSSPYAVSKILVENQCEYYRRRGLDCIVARPFNHIGPGQGKGFILPDFYERLQAVDDNEVIPVGNINTKRDYTDVRDIVEAYSKLLLAPTLKETTYNICSGSSLSGREILDKLKGFINKPNVKFEIDQALVRPNDAPEIIGDSSRIKNELGWKPTYSIDTTIEDFVKGNQQL